MKYFETIRNIVIVVLLIGGYFLVIQILQIWNDADRERQWNHCIKGLTVEGISEEKAFDACNNIVP